MFAGFCYTCGSFIKQKFSVLQTITYHQTTIRIGEEFNNLESYLPAHASQVVLLVDENVLAHPNYDFNAYSCISIASGESSKSIAKVEEIIGQLIELGLDRNSILVGIGGGVVCDITGFVASIFMRGISFGFVPTTLLAQVDASIGGKNGVNLGAYKNMIGTINQPKFILIDFNFLGTLPKQEFISGMAEVVKHACIADRSYFEFLEHHCSEILSLQIEAVETMILHSVRIKTQIVESDELEAGLRKMLNYGHTFGHAIEKSMQIPHGEAVSLGMMVVNEIACKLKMLESKKSQRIEQLLNSIGLPTQFSKQVLENSMHLVVKDKKRAGKKIDLILLRDIGRAEIVPLDFQEIQSLIKL